MYPSVKPRKNISTLHNALPALADVGLNPDNKV
jgi:hypothetical protein